MILVEGLSKTYGDVRAVDGVSFRVAAGEVVGFLGPNGAGKSTTMRILTGFLHADAGRVEVAGRTVDPDDPSTRAPIGYLPEHTPLYRNMRVADYLDFMGRLRHLARGARREAIGRVLEMCGLVDWEKRRIAHLSRGYRQRVGLAQALLPDPQVLVLDEPTSGLDPAEITRIRALVEELGKTKTILLSTHILAEVQETCPRVIILAGGRIVADGSTLDLAAEEAVELHVTLAADAAEAAELVRGIEGVTDVRTLGSDAEGRVRLALSVADRFRVAAELSRAVHAKGWDLIELHHDLPSLERVFLSRTERRGRSEEAPA